MEKNRKVLELLSELLEKKGVGREEIEGMLEIVHPVDLAFILEEFTPEEKVKVFHQLDLDAAASVLVELDDDSTREVVNGLPREHVQKVLGAMTPDDAAATVRLISSEQGRDAALEFLSRKQRDKVRELLHFDEETAGALMNTNYVSVSEDMTAAEGLKTLQGAVQANTVVYVYVVDSAGHLKGVLSIRSLLRAAPDTKIRDIMKSDMISVPPEMDQEEVARIVKRYGLEAVPVVNSEGKILGVVTAESIFDILAAEAGEDLLKMAGTGGASIFSDAVTKRVILRMPWLIPPLLGGLVVGKIQHGFAHIAPEEFISLVLFIPVMMGMAGNVAVQSSTLIVRGLATGEVKLTRVMRILLGELGVGFLIGITCGALIGLAGWLTTGHWHIGVVVATSMLVGVTIAALNGTGLPLLLFKFKIDPAVSAGPFITALNDISATLIYMAVALILLKFIG